ncbi:indole-3-glycerol phosphate synthase TrpC [Chondrinema litorale]|uniref:indole-3-glycerol phosphate synthase TrpC n=1 Tax=Chondrinema litorale TaxID=2994555 RepID=UPI0025445076|nr:indole-3-glycerol phosphate synthase TrpC [Chondrinema litorale]UZR92716.1 indole-3-glycerol phosphate synthase TrpC [Chondrinema litorale]
MDILEKIVAHKIEETRARKEAVSVKELETSALFPRETFSLKKHLTNTPFGIIAEFKRRSPSKGLINGTATPEEVTKAYAAAGVSAVSVLTDNEFFGGSTADLMAVRKGINIPVLRKDFTTEEYHIIEAKSIGADAVLLIAAALEVDTLKNLAKLAKSLNLEVLLEVHNVEELHDYYNEFVDVVGINNRNLKTFEVSIETSVKVQEEIPAGQVKISESGISAVENIHYLKKYGFNGFLIGENFMKTANPGEACKLFFEELKQKA